MKHKYQKGDEVTINALVIAVSESGNSIVRLKNGMRLLVKDSDITSVHPFDEPPKEDKRRGR